MTKVAQLDSDRQRQAYSCHLKSQSKATQIKPQRQRCALDGDYVYNKQDDQCQHMLYYRKTP